MGFQGFPREGLELLGRLPTFDREGFAAAKKEYDRTILSPAKAFVDAMGEALRARISAGVRFAAKTNGSIAPIHNDLRFAPDRAPYKDHLLFRFWEGPVKKTAPLYVRLAHDGVGFATGQMFEDVGAWRAAVDAHGAELADAVDVLVAATDADVAGAELKRVPAPYPADHRQGDLLRHKWIQIRWPREMPASVSTAAFVDSCAEELERTAGVHRWLVEHMG